MLCSFVEGDEWLSMVFLWLTAQDYNRLKPLLVDLTRQSRGMQAGVDTLEEILDLARV